MDPPTKTTNSRSKSDPNEPACFAQTLKQELAEVEKLRRKRQWENGRDTSGTTLADTICRLYPTSDSAGKEKESVSSDDYGRQSVASDCDGDADDVFEQARELSLVGLAFSGGGIRSATFNLGVLQGLAEHQLLPMFDYLSTVSGGGYIGSWLSAWIYRVGQDARKEESEKSERARGEPSPIRRVQDFLVPDRSKQQGHAEPRPIRFLREYSNYLTPRLGFLGADTWTAIAVYTRNLFLNQLILISFLAAILLLPHIIGRVTQAVFPGPDTPLADCLAPAAAFLLIVLALVMVGLNMLNLTGAESNSNRYFPWYSEQRWILWLVVAPLVSAAWIASAWLWHKPRGWQVPNLALVFTFLFAVVWAPVSVINLHKTGSDAPHWGKGSTLFWAILSSFFSVGVGALLLWTLKVKVFEAIHADGEIWRVASFGTPLMVMIFLVVGALQIGLMGLDFPDFRREWWARVGGYLLIFSGMWIALFAAAIYSPLGLMWLTGKIKRKEALIIAWLGSTLAGVFGGKSASTGNLNSRSWKDLALSVTPYVFIVGLASAIALLLEVSFAKLSERQDLLACFIGGNNAPQKFVDWVGISLWRIYGHGTIAVAAPTYVQAHWQILSLGQAYRPFLLFVILMAVCVLLSWRFNINEFSMNLFYRNRLVRAYLGASNIGRKSNPFTGLDPHDDLQMSELRSEMCYSGPFPIVNSALNLVTGKDLAWQERKAESFVFTPLRCGFDTWLEQIDLAEEYENPKKSHDVRKYGFRPTDHYGFKDAGLRLGTAVSVSGAAASPNMGYHSSPSLAFLMALFNVRLGFWAGNPRRETAWQYPGPRIGLLYLLAELFGQTNDEATCVYLSDGGHFENLGIYELVKRRCKYVIACDADSDGTYTFGDLGNAMRKCREDIGVEIDLTTDELRPTASSHDRESSGGSKSKDTNAKISETHVDKFSKWHWAIGTIRYDLVDHEKDGILVYLKTSLTGDEQADVLTYNREHPEFPHQTTGDQWFTESQFESYRRLGQHVVERLLEPVVGVAHREQIFTKKRDATSTESVFKSIQNHWRHQKADDGGSVAGLTVND